ncbi:hypothetical protein LZK73_12055 [Neorhizobium galegae]|nr:hypothetical protein LZK73_12055 [Neorhizobium galegae]
MTTVYTGSVFGIRELSEEQRETTRRELAWLETDLIRRRKRLAYWSLRKVQAETIPGIREELRQSAFHFMPVPRNWSIQANACVPTSSRNCRTSRITGPPITTPTDATPARRGRWTSKTNWNASVNGRCP